MAKKNGNGKNNGNGKDNGNINYYVKPFDCDNLPGEPACMKCQRNISKPFLVCKRGGGCPFFGLNKKKIAQMIQVMRVAKVSGNSLHAHQ